MIIDYHGVGVSLHTYLVLWLGAELTLLRCTIDFDRRYSQLIQHVHLENSFSERQFARLNNRTNYFLGLY